MRQILSLVLILAAWCALATVGRCGPTDFHYNVDWQTHTPPGPVWLDFNSFSLDTSPATYDEYTFHFGARNSGGTVQQDVFFLLQFVYDTISALSFDDATNTWSGNAHTMVFPGLPEFSMANTDAPTSFFEPDLGFTGVLAADRSDTVPYVNIGDIPAHSVVNFDLIADVSNGFNHFNVVASFVSLPAPEGGPNLPEPSTFALLGVGGAGLYLLRRRLRG